MSSVYLVCDESGSLKRGTPNSPGEFGVIGGIVLHNGNHATVSTRLTWSR